MTIREKWSAQSVEIALLFFDFCADPRLFVIEMVKSSDSLFLRFFGDPVLNCAILHPEKNLRVCFDFASFIIIIYLV